jgi:hypothetical protein
MAMDRWLDQRVDWLFDALLRAFQIRVWRIPVFLLFFVILICAFAIWMFIWTILYSQPLCPDGASCPGRTLPWE